MLREHDCDEIIETPIPKDVNANGNPIPMNVRERQDFNRALRDYKEKDKIAYARIIKSQQAQTSLCEWKFQDCKRDPCSTSSAFSLGG
jgi:hypothetical protein